MVCVNVVNIVRWMINVIKKEELEVLNKLTQVAEVLTYRLVALEIKVKALERRRQC